MFAKPFKIKSQTAIKGSDRKKLRAQISGLFPTLSPDSLATLIPAKEEMTVMKIYTSAGDSAVVYVLQKTPVFYELFDRLYPSVYTLWKCPDLLPVFTTWPPVFSKMAGGADLMLPGVVVKGELSLPPVNKGGLCAVRLVGNKCPVAVGKALMSSEDMRESGMKGKGVRVCHIFGDELWSFGDKSEPPMLPDPDFSMAEFEGDSVERLPGDAEEPSPGDTPPIESLTLDSQSDSQADMENGITEGAEGGAEIPDEETEVEACATEIITPAEMDRLLQEALLTALKTKVKKSDLPLLTSNLYRNFMLPCSTRKEILDVKKSSHKKLSKFLNSVSKGGLLKVKELSKGVESVTDIDKSHPDYRNFDPPEVVDAEPVCSHGDQSGDFKPPRIQEMYSVTSVTLPIFQPAGYGKGSALSSAQVRTAITDYVRANDLQVENKKSVVTVDPLLGDVVLGKGEVNTTHLSWEELLSRFLQKMTVVHQVTFPGHAPVIRKGKLEPITIDVVQRASNKKVTLVDNLEVFGIDAADFAHRVQVSKACSASANQTQQKNKGLQVLVQGNQVNFMADLLLGEYQIPRKYIKGLEKAPKSGKRR